MKRLLFALLLIAAALHLPVKALALDVVAGVLGLGAAHTGTALIAAATVAILRLGHRYSRPIVTKLAGARIARVLIGGER